MSRSSRPSDWMKNLPFVLLGVRLSTRDDSAISPAHLLYGSPLRLPGEFFSSFPHVPVSSSDFVAELQHSFRALAPFPADFHVGPGRPAAVPKSLRSCPAVFVRVDAVKRPLTPPYVGPYKVLERSDKTFSLLKSGKPWVVSVDRLKPFFLPVMSAPLSPSPVSTSSSSVPTSASPRPPPLAAAPPSAASVPQMSRSCRLLRQPDRFVP